MEFLTEHFDDFVNGFFRSLSIALWGAVGSLLLGTLLAVFRVSPIPVLQGFGAAYVTLVRNTPLTVLLFGMAFGVPGLGINASFYLFGVVTLILYTAAFVCEAIRSGIATVPIGQAEAARAIGLTFGQSLGLVILPQAMRSVVPPVGSVIIAMIKNSAVVGAAGVGSDLFSVYKRMTSALGYAPLPVLTAVAVAFLIMTLSTGALLALAERRMAVAR
ncbi:glutamate transport system permease protein [Kineococcus xinjiangensis]|uniref:Glutamate transport system permease protein n=1 Tax=Kineococcus xinjiangensis TaxID=512762 RepID=A0A2S6IW01_9ACTN|nr:amino acid ABC transporter permease [Kineococcus xinjiangensis]PPK98456.1 glutamate transport system permease protein [Kineococcus xinjiangensis]